MLDLQTLRDLDAQRPDGVPELIWGWKVQEVVMDMAEERVTDDDCDLVRIMPAQRTPWRLQLHLPERGPSAQPRRRQICIHHLFPRFYGQILYRHGRCADTSVVE